MAWPGFMFGIKRCCGCTEEGCLLFERTSFPNLNGLTIQSGTVIAEDNLLKVTGPALILIDAMPAALQDGIRLYAKVKRTGGADPSKVRPFGGYKDVDNYYFGEWDYDVAGNAATIRDWKKFNGSESALSDAVTVHDDTELSGFHELCYGLRPPQPQESEPRIEFGLPNSVTGGGVWAGHDGAKLPFAIDAASATHGLSTGTPTSATLTAHFTLGIQAGSTITGFEYGVWCKATQAREIRIVALDFSCASGGRSWPLADTAAAIVPVDFDDFGEGGPGELLGLTPSATDFDACSISVAFERDTGGLPDLVEVDYFVLNVWYNTPDKTPGRVTFAFTNLETGADPQIHCVDASFDEVLQGKQTGLEFPYGNWEVSALKLDYHQSVSKPECPRCACGDAPPDPDDPPPPPSGDGGGTADCVCCGASPPEFMAHRRYIADLGFGGWTNNLCLGCDTINGAYLLEFIPESVLGFCTWIYTRLVALCPPSNPPVMARLLISLRLRPITTDASACVWQLGLTYLPISTVGLPGSAIFSTVVYLANRTVGDSNCGDDTPIVFTKVSEAHYPIGGAGPCSGTMPATVIVVLG